MEHAYINQTKPSWSIPGVHNRHQVEGHNNFGRDQEGRINNFYTSRQFFSHFAKNVHISSVYFFDIIRISAARDGTVINKLPLF